VHHLLSLRNLDTLSKFKKTIRSSISMPIPRHYSYGPRKLNIILTQLCCNASFLNYDLCKVKILSNASCNCGVPCENSHHFFFDCDKYTDNREIIFNSLNWIPSNINIDVNLLTKGSDLLTYQENITVFKHACTKSGSLRFSQFSGCWLILSVYIIMSFDFPFVRLFGVR
jgi:hypothetical protein